MSIESKIKCPYCKAELDVEVDFKNGRHKKEIKTCDVCGKDFVLHSFLEVMHDYNKVEEKK